MDTTEPTYEAVKADLGFDPTASEHLTHEEFLAKHDQKEWLELVEELLQHEPETDEQGDEPEKQEVEA